MRVRPPRSHCSSAVSAVNCCRATYLREQAPMRRASRDGGSIGDLWRYVAGRALRGMYLDTLLRRCLAGRLCLLARMFPDSIYRVARRMRCLRASALGGVLALCSPLFLEFYKSSLVSICSIISDVFSLPSCKDCKTNSSWMVAGIRGDWGRVRSRELLV